MPEAFPLRPVSSRRDQLERVLGAALGFSVAFLVASRLAPVPSTLLCSIALAGAGSLAGHAFSTTRSLYDRHPKDLLRSASALTTGLFAVLVTLTFIHGGLDAARTFSSRLSTSLTILVASLSVPGWLIHLLVHPAHSEAHD